MKISFTIPGDPKGKGRPRFSTSGGHVHTHTPKETAAYEDLVKWAYIQQGGILLKGAIDAEITGFFRIPASAPKKQQQAMASETVEYTHKVDCDNLAKIILDSLNGLAYKDDAQVSFLKVHKVYSPDPRVEVTLTALEGERMVAGKP